MDSKIEVDKATLIHLTSKAVENYEDEVAFHQGMLATYFYGKFKARRWRTRLLPWLFPHVEVSFTDVVEWIEELKVPGVVVSLGLVAEWSELIYAAALREDHIPYVTAKKFLSTKEKEASYNLTASFYNWLVSRQDI